MPRSLGFLEAVGLVMMALCRVGFRLGAAAGDNSPAAWNSGSRPLRRRERRGRSAGIGSYVREMRVDYISTLELPVKFRQASTHGVDGRPE